MHVALQVLLRALEHPLQNPSGPLLAVARIVPDYQSYKSTMLMKTPRLAGINVTTVKYPDPLPSSFNAPHHTSQGHPQVSPAALPPEQPVWDHSFLFQGRDSATIFTAGAALILEYYCVSSVMNTVSWFGRSPLGFSGVPLSQDVYHKLMAENGGRGLKVDSLQVQGTSLRTTSGTTPTVGLILRLIGSERPDSILAVTYPSLVASVGAVTPRDALGLKHQPDTQRALAVGSPDPSSGPGQTTTAEWTLSAIQDQASDIAPAPQAKLLKERVNFPPYDALAQVLPEYDYLFRATSPKESPKMATRSHQSPVRAPEPLQTQDPVLFSPKRVAVTEDNVGNNEVVHHEGQFYDKLTA
ncbi:coiled-coil domain-containing protein 33-like [Leucoraja erinacea]|uniref:coiled-coil domain-containing protein 33-like n=1 Tax=Leucoraja erinaceus TaxID=7782 RepID=UPI002458DDBB|nr:coiled-coil domain-containing protein 33-like [Leucoraja erinacea]